MTIIEEDAARIREILSFHRIPGTATVTHTRKGLACIDISGVTGEWANATKLWLLIGHNRCDNGNSAMRLTVNGLVHERCQSCNCIQPVTAFEGRKRENCYSCRERRRTAYKPDPLKEAARRATKKAIREGLVRDEPEACEDCGRTDENLTVHHLDYSDPLNIEWLCTGCHGRRHRGWRRYYAFKSPSEARAAWI